MSERIGIVWNPSKVAEPELRRAAEQAGAADVLWFETSPDDPGRSAAEAALDAGCTLVLAAGGDGTVRAVAERLGESGEAAADLGIVPLGTGNLLARNLEVPLGDPSAAIARAVQGDAAPLDLGEVVVRDSSGAETRYGFVVMVGFGVDAHMIAETDSDLKHKAGWLAYVESLGRATAATAVLDFTLGIDGAAGAHERAHTLLIANCGTLQAGITLLPDARPYDGELDLLLLRADDTRAWFDTLKNMVWVNGLKRILLATRPGKRRGALPAAESSASTSHLRGRHVQATLSEPRAFEIDGDEIGEITHFEVRVLPGALRVR